MSSNCRFWPWWNWWDQLMRACDVAKSVVVTFQSVGMQQRPRSHHSSSHPHSFEFGRWEGLKFPRFSWTRRRTKSEWTMVTANVEEHICTDLNAQSSAMLQGLVVCPIGETWRMVKPFCHLRVCQTRTCLSAHIIGMNHFRIYGKTRSVARMSVVSGTLDWWWFFVCN